MLRLAVGERDFLPSVDPAPRGVSVQARLYAEMPSHNFQPATGLVTRAEFPEDARVETWLRAGLEVTSYYDPMLAKVIVSAPTRSGAIERLGAALEGTRVDGVETNRDYLLAIVRSDGFRSGGVCTSFLKDFSFRPRLVEVLDGGIESLVVDYPGRVGYWEVGVPPSGPFDDRSFREANCRVGNPEGSAGLEMTLRGATLRFHCSAWCCLVGAEMGAELDGQPVALGKPFLVRAGQMLRCGEARGPGLRCYLAVKGGLDVPDYLGSKTTFRLGGFGGHGGRALRAGDFLRLAEPLQDDCEVAAEPLPTGCEEWRPGWGSHWTIAVSYGPHGAPDFFTAEDIEEFFATDWEVHYNSARTGVRLIGPKPRWARPDGGEAGLHPSNIHDCAYQVGAVDFTGDMPVILGPDGPSLGGFVCPVTVLSGEFWKVGQLRPGDRVRFHPVELGRAAEGVRARAVVEPPVVLGEEGVVYRRQGDTGVLVEYGEMTLDLALRFRVQALYEHLKKHGHRGLRDLTPGVRSLQVRYEPREISYEGVLAHLREAEAALPQMDDLVVPSRVVHLPLSWDDPATRLAIERYMQSVRADAPWCPSNIEFIRRINGLESVEEVRRIVFEASYLVLGLGDVYLGAPVATPLDPRHRLVTTKYNPARTWTPENAVGIGGAYMCIYGMEGPGGYQFVGRTVPVWNRWRSTRVFAPGVPWLLRFFDQVRFYPVSHDELQALRRDILTGQFEPRIEEVGFRFKDYEVFLEREAESIRQFRETQRRAFAEERERWKAAGRDESALQDSTANGTGGGAEPELPEGCERVFSPAAGSLWRLLVRPGQRVAEGETVAILESMKMEIPCVAPIGGVVAEVFVGEGRPVAPGQLMMGIRP